jgi:hypothetical protein
MSCKSSSVLCFIALFATTAYPQKFTVEPLHIAPGSILTFYVQTRLRPNGGAIDTLAKGTALQVKILDSIDSDVNRDGTDFRGSLVSSVVSGNETVLHSDAEVHGILALLRSKNHPDGFRYELLITGLTDHGKNITLTASLGLSFSDIAAHPDSTSPDIKDKPHTNKAPFDPPLHIFL